MAMYWANPRPVLVVNDETGEFVMTRNITRVVKTDGGSLVYVRADVSAGNYTQVSFIKSPLTPKEIYHRMFDMSIE